MEKAIGTLRAMFLPSDSSNPPPKHLPQINTLHRILLGLETPSKPDTQVEDIDWFDNSLNPSQKTAIKFALCAPEVACIWGPPGKKNCN